MISQTELDILREVATQAMTDTCVVVRYTRVQEGLNWKDTWADQGSYPCRIAQNKSAREVEIGGQLQSVNTHLVHLPYGTDVTEVDRVRVTTGGSERVFNVNGVIEKTFATDRTITCTETR